MLYSFHLFSPPSHLSYVHFLSPHTSIQILPTYLHQPTHPTNYPPAYQLIHSSIHQPSTNHSTFPQLLFWRYINFYCPNFSYSPIFPILHFLLIYFFVLLFHLFTYFSAPLLISNPSIYSFTLLSLTHPSILPPFPHSLIHLPILLAHS